MGRILIGATGATVQRVYMSTCVYMSDCMLYMYIYRYIQKLYFHKTIKCCHVHVIVICYHAESDDKGRRDYVHVCFQNPLIIAFSAETVTEV